jgi:hypothetical protein
VVDFVSESCFAVSRVGEFDAMSTDHKSQANGRAESRENKQIVSFEAPTSLIDEIDRLSERSRSEEIRSGLRARLEQLRNDTEVGQ